MKTKIKKIILIAITLIVVCGIIFGFWELYRILEVYEFNKLGLDHTKVPITTIIPRLFMGGVIGWFLGRTTGKLLLKIEDKFFK